MRGVPPLVEDLMLLYDCCCYCWYCYYCCCSYLALYQRRKMFSQLDFYHQNEKEADLNSLDQFQMCV